MYKQNIVPAMTKPTMKVRKTVRYLIFHCDETFCVSYTHPVVSMLTVHFVAFDVLKDSHSSGDNIIVV